MVKLFQTRKAAKAVMGGRKGRREWMVKRGDLRAEVRMERGAVMKSGPEVRFEWSGEGGGGDYRLARQFGGLGRGFLCAF